MMGIARKDVEKNKRTGQWQRGKEMEWRGKGNA